MKLETLSGLIVQLVLENGRVMLPQLGAFMRETVPASFSDRGFTLLPPYRRLVFRESQGDGTLLCEALSRQARLTPQRAQAEIEACVRELKEQLEQENQALIPGLGRLKRTASGGLLFVQDEDLDVSGELMALDAVSLKSQDRLAAASFRSAPAEPVVTVPEQEVSESAISEESETVPEPEPVVETPEQKNPDPVGNVGNDELTGKVGKAEIDAQTGVDVVKKRRLSPGWVVLIVLGVLAVLLVALFYAGVWFFPDILDKFLYDESELELLKYFGLTR